MNTAYKKFYCSQPLTIRDIKSLELIDRIRYLLKCKPKDRWTAKEVREKLLNIGVIGDFITQQNIEDEMAAFYG